MFPVYFETAAIEAAVPYIQALHIVEAQLDGGLMYKIAFESFKCPQESLAQLTHWIVALMQASHVILMRTVIQPTRVSGVDGSAPSGGGFLALVASRG